MAQPKTVKVPGDIDKQPELRDRVLILAYLEELSTLGSQVQFQLADPLAPPILARIEKVQEDRAEFEAMLSRALPGNLGAKDRLKLLFPLDSQRFTTEVAFLDRVGFMRARFTFPTVIHHGERRTMPRVRFTPRENASVTLLESLFEGNGAYGRLVNLSMGGALVRMDRAIAVQGQRRLTPSPDLFQPGTRLDFIRIQDLPHVSMLECRGVVCHAERSPIGITLGLRFEGMDPLDLQLLNQVIRKRAPHEATGFPIKYPKSRRQAGAEGEPAPTPPVEAWEDPPDPKEETPKLQAPPRPDTHDRLIQIKKRGKRILVIMLDDLDRAILGATLLVDGFTRVGEVRNYLDAINWLRVNTPDVVIVDHHVGVHSGQQIVEKLRSQGFLDQSRIIMLAQAGDVRALIQAKASQMDRVIRYPIDYDGEMRPFLMELLDLK